jgi:hypothetical protein
MNSSENRASESPRPSGKPLPEGLKPPVRPLPPPTKPAPVAATTAKVEEAAPAERQEPIPPPSHPRQYRAIGLIQGQYQRSEEQMTRGILVTSDGTEIEAVLLGRVISLVKNHLDLEKPHLWVVYPRTRQNDDRLHIQIVGVWEPETLKLEQAEKSDATSTQTSASSIRDGYFSIRGEVVYYSQEKEIAIVKIRQSPKQETDRPKFFKLKLQGKLSDRPVGNFWDLQVQLQSDNLIVQEATDLGQLFRKKQLPRKPRYDRDQRPERSEKPSKRQFPSDSQIIPREKRPEANKPSSGERTIVPKPIQKKDQ